MSDQDSPPGLLLPMSPMKGPDFGLIGFSHVFTVSAVAWFDPEIPVPEDAGPVTTLAHATLEAFNAVIAPFEPVLELLFLVIVGGIAVVIVGTLGFLTASVIVSRHEYSTRAVGRYQWVETDSEVEIDTCLWCDRADDAGVETRYGHDWVLAGVRVRRRLEGVHTDCATCHDDPVAGQLEAEGVDLTPALDHTVTEEGSA